MNIKKFNTDEEAVSPVIGVILMVAITVILAAVIGAFVLDLGSNQQENVNAGVSFDQSGSEVTIQLTDSGNADGIYLNTDSGDPSWVDSSGNAQTDKSTAGYALENVGDSVTIDTGSGDFSGTTEITVIAESGDSENVINNYEVN